jgi:hypothetical protein
MSPPDLPQLYLSLREAARRQLDALAADDLEAFTRATDDRERTFAAIRDRDGELQALEDARSAEIGSTIREILAIDAELQATATRQAALIQEELAMVQQGMNALHAYAVESLPQSYFIDRSS